MATIYFTITGINHYYGNEVLAPGTEVTLVKEPDNKVDKEAIKVEMPALGKVGYVANSHYSIIGESYSAGRIYDKIGDTASGKVLYKLPQGLICVLNESDIISEK